MIRVVEILEAVFAEEVLVRKREKVEPLSFVTKIQRTFRRKPGDKLVVGVEVGETIKGG